MPSASISPIFLKCRANAKRPPPFRAAVWILRPVCGRRRSERWRGKVGVHISQPVAAGPKCGSPSRASRPAAAPGPLRVPRRRPPSNRRWPRRNLGRFPPRGRAANGGRFRPAARGRGRRTVLGLERGMSCEMKQTAAFESRFYFVVNATFSVDRLAFQIVSNATSFCL